MRKLLVMLGVVVILTGCGRNRANPAQETDVVTEVSSETTEAQEVVSDIDETTLETTETISEVIETTSEAIETTVRVNRELSYNTDSIGFIFFEAPILELNDITDITGTVTDVEPNDEVKQILLKVFNEYTVEDLQRFIGNFNNGDDNEKIAVAYIMKIGICDKEDVIYLSKVDSDSLDYYINLIQ